MYSLLKNMCCKFQNLGSRESILLASHPVGSYYWSDSSTDPSILFGGGVWTQIHDCFVYAQGTKPANTVIEGEEYHLLLSEESGVPGHTHTTVANSTGYESSHTHSLNGHTHSFSADMTHYHTFGDYVVAGCLASKGTAASYCVSSSSSSTKRVPVRTDASASDMSWRQGTSNSTRDSVSGTTGVNNNNSGTGSSHNHSIPQLSVSANSESDASSPHNNMPPYIVAYCWRRDE